MGNGRDSDDVETGPSKCMVIFVRCVLEVVDDGFHGGPNVFAVVEASHKYDVFDRFRFLSRRNFSGGFFQVKNSLHGDTFFVVEKGWIEEFSV